MVLLENILYLLAGFALLVLSGDKLVETSIRIARRWKIPASVIAVTIIAAGTSAPELVTSFMAGLKNNGDIAVGNVMGSNVFNILAVGGLSLMLQPFGSIKKTFVSWLTLIGGTLLFFFSISDLSLSQLEAGIFLLSLLAFLVLSFFQEREKESTFENLDSVSFTRTLLFFLISLGGLVLGAELALDGGVTLGKIAGLSERIIAITIISVGTGLPELATSMAAAYRGHSDIAVANVVGSNIFNTLAIPGATALFFPLKIDAAFLTFDFYVMATATLLVGALFFVKSPILRRGFGLLLFCGYSAYATRLLFNLG